MKYYSVFYLPDAQRDIASIYDYVSGELGNEFVATRIVQSITRKCESLRLFPKGQAVRLRLRSKDIRFAHQGTYTIAFFVDDSNSTVNIYAVKYSRMDLVERLNH